MKSTKPDLNWTLPEAAAQFDRSLQSTRKTSHHMHLVTNELRHPKRHYEASVESVPAREDAFAAGSVLQWYVGALQLLQPVSHAKAGR